MTIKKIEKKSESVEAAVEKKSMSVAKNAAELGSNLRKTDSEKITVIYGNLVLKKNTTFENSIRVEGDIVGKDGMRYDLKVKGNIFASGLIIVNGINAWNIYAQFIRARNIKARDVIYGLEDINARNITTPGYICTSYLNALNITAGKISSKFIYVRRDLNVFGNIRAVKDIKARNITVSGDIKAYELEADNVNVRGDIDTYYIKVEGNVSAQNIHVQECISVKNLNAQENIYVGDSITVQNFNTRGNITVRGWIDAQHINVRGNINTPFIICESLIRSKEKKFVCKNLMEKRSTHEIKEVKR